MAMDPIFEGLINVIKEQQNLIQSIAEKVEKLDGLGGGGSASIEDYASGKKYTRNMLVVDKNTETVYRVIPDEYISTDVDTDASNNYLKLVGFESQIVAFSHEPTQKEIDALPDDVLVTIYSPADTPYTPPTQG